MKLNRKKSKIFIIFSLSKVFDFPFGYLYPIIMIIKHQTL